MRICDSFDFVTFDRRETSDQILKAIGDLTKLLRCTVHIKYKEVGILEGNHCEFVVQLVL